MSEEQDRKQRLQESRKIKAEKEALAARGIKNVDRYWEIQDLVVQARVAIAKATPGPWCEEGGCIWGYENREDIPRDPEGGTSQVYNLGKKGTAKNIDLALFSMNHLSRLLDLTMELLKEEEGNDMPHDKDVSSRHGEIQDEVIAVMNDCLKGKTVQPDRVAYAFRELREKIEWVVHGGGASTTPNNGRQWLSDVVKQTKLDPVEEALGIIKNLTSEDSDTPPHIKNNLYRARHMLEGRKDA